MLAGQYAQQLLLLPSQQALQLERLQQQTQQQRALLCWPPENTPRQNAAGTGKTLLEAAY
jgi:hypothetical protein